MPEIKVVIPTHGRSDIITTHKVVANAAICVAESQAPIYKTNYERLKLAKAEILETKSMLPGVKDERDYAIKKGKVLERFTEEFHAKHRHDALYVSVYEALIRDADPYEIIEKLIAVNDAQFKHIQLIIRYVSADYYLEKQKQK